MKHLESEVRQYLVERKWDKLRPSDLAKSICIEAAELLEIFQWSAQGLDEVQQDEVKMELIKKELADVLIYAFDMAVLLNLDVTDIMRAKLAKIKEKYPAELVRQNVREGVEPGTDPLYLQIKKDFRQRGDT